MRGLSFIQPRLLYGGGGNIIFLLNNWILKVLVQFLRLVNSSGFSKFDVDYL